MSRQNIKRLMLIGEQKVGKTSIISYLLKKRHFESEHLPTVGVEAGIISYQFENPKPSDTSNRFKQEKEVENSEINKIGKQFAVVQLWDTAGKHQLHDYVCQKFYNDIDGFVIVVDLGDQNTLKSVNWWSQKIQRVKGSKYGYKIMVVANKSDLPKHQFTQADFKKMYPNLLWSGQFSLKEQAKDSEKTQVEVVFEKIVRELYDQRLPQIVSVDSSSAPISSNCSCSIM